jgi:shikimate dehydrogenase
MHGLDVRYRLMDGVGVAGFDAYQVARRCADEGFTGVNVTQPFKRHMREHVAIADPAVGRIGAVNTVLFSAVPEATTSQSGSKPWQGRNTDYSGFIRAYRSRFGDTAPGNVVMTGAGGVGRAIAFALATLGCSRLAMCDESGAIAQDLAAEVTTTTTTRATAVSLRDLPAAMEGASGLVNATPLGTHLRPGCAFPLDHVRQQRWAFDAVYTPVWTEWMRGSRAAGLEVLTGFELFFGQGLDAFEAFTGRITEPTAVRNVVEGWVRGASPS